MGMRKKIYVVGEKTFTLGFELAGIRNVVNTENMHESEIFEKLMEIAEKGEAGLVIVEDKVYEKLEKRAKRMLESFKEPLFISFSEKFGSETLREKILQTIGIDLLG